MAITCATVPRVPGSETVSQLNGGIIAHITENRDKKGRGMQPQSHLICGSLGLLCFIGAVRTSAQTPVGGILRAGPDATAAVQTCAALRQANFEDVTGAPARITLAELVDVAPGEFENQAAMSAAPARSSRIKQYCRVTGYVAPQNKFELRLPLPSDWNQNFFFVACGGFCGSVNSNGCNAGLARGYASVTGNGGHDSIPGFDGLWAAGAPNLQEDYAWRSNHVITLAAKAITERFYGRPIRHSYMSGCSKGGQAVLMEAQRFPEDFDGWMPAAPVYNLTGTNISAAWFTQAFSDGKGGSVLNAAAAEYVHRSVLATCGAQTGVDIGLVTEPGLCNWRPEMIACRGEASGPDCLTAAQVSAIKRLMTPVTNSNGEVLYAYPYIPGTETQWVGWNFPRNGALASQTANFTVSEQFVKYLADAEPRTGVDPLKFNFDRDPATLARAHHIYDATSYDLRALKARGGKILMWHGLADGGIMATSSMGYYEGVMKAMGGRQKTEEFFRLFLIPGVHHCAGGPGLTNFDALTALENWVEKGQPPAVLIAQRLASGAPERVLPIYPYPVVPRYSGSGDPKQAGSFIPFDPTKK
jgi:feruloyl esterase